MLHYTSFGSNLEQADFQLKIFLDRTFLTLPDCNDNFFLVLAVSKLKPQRN
jgi:hypothetical protein